jgi:hypothetical protein
MTITPAELLTQTAIGNGYHRWPVEGGAIEVARDELEEVLVTAYDETNPDWQALIGWDEDGFYVV